MSEAWDRLGAVDWGGDGVRDVDAALAGDAADDGGLDAADGGDSWLDALAGRLPVRRRLCGLVQPPNPATARRRRCSRRTPCVRDARRQERDHISARHRRLPPRHRGQRQQQKKQSGRGSRYGARHVRRNITEEVNVKDEA